MIIKKEKQYTLYISEAKDGCASLFCDKKWFWTNQQVHGNRIIKITDPKKFKNRTKKADGIITNILHQKIGVRVADCNAIILMWKNWFWAVHAGWRGLQKKIIPKAIKMLEKEWEDMNSLKVYVWPSIRACCYDVGKELEKYFSKKYFLVKKGKIYLDMIAYIIDVLVAMWVKKGNINIDKHCTKCSKKFFSYRRWNNQKRIIIGVEKK